MCETASFFRAIETMVRFGACWSIEHCLSYAYAMESSRSVMAELWQLLVEDCPHGVVELRADGEIVNINSVCAHWFGHEPDDLIGTYVWRLFPPSVAAFRREMLDRCLSKQVPIRFPDRGRLGESYITRMVPIMTGTGPATAAILVISRERQFQVYDPARQARVL